MGRRWGLVVVVAAVACQAAVARAGECTPQVVRGSPALARVDARARLRFVRERLRVEARRARVWSWSWAGAYSALTLGQAIPIPFVSAEKRPDLYVGATASFVGLIPLAVMPLRVMGDQRWLERRLATAPPGTHECALLAEAETLLVRDARNQAFGRSEVVHVGNVAVNAIIFAIIGAGFGHWTGAVISAVTGIVVGEVQIFTQPVGLVTDLARYRAGDLRPPTAAPVRVALAPFVPRAAAGRPGATLGAALALEW